MDQNVVPFDSVWIDAVCRNLGECENLRHAVTLAATHLTAMLEWGIDNNGWDPEWKAHLVGFCAQASATEASEAEDNEDAEIAAAGWESSEDILRLYGKLNHLSDWEVYAQTCLRCGDAGDDFPDKMELGLGWLIFAVSFVHGAITCDCETQP